MSNLGKWKKQKGAEGAKAIAEQEKVEEAFKKTKMR
jgi:hypothetical protein